MKASSSITPAKYRDAAESFINLIESSGNSLANKEWGYYLKKLKECRYELYQFSEPLNLTKNDLKPFGKYLEDSDKKKDLINKWSLVWKPAQDWLVLFQYKEANKPEIILWPEWAKAKDPRHYASPKILNNFQSQEKNVSSYLLAMLGSANINYNLDKLQEQTLGALTWDCDAPLEVPLKLFDPIKEQISHLLTMDGQIIREHQISTEPERKVIVIGIYINDSAEIICRPLKAI